MKISDKHVYLQITTEEHTSIKVPDPKNLKHDKIPKPGRQGFCKDTDVEYVPMNAPESEHLKEDKQLCLVETSEENDPGNVTVPHKLNEDDKLQITNRRVCFLKTSEDVPEPKQLCKIDEEFKSEGETYLRGKAKDNAQIQQDSLQESQEAEDDAQQNEPQRRKIAAWLRSVFLSCCCLPNKD